jgi:hypothetical protein
MECRHCEVVVPEGWLHDEKSEEHGATVHRLWCRLTVSGCEFEPSVEVRRAPSDVLCGGLPLVTWRLARVEGGEPVRATQVSGGASSAAAALHAASIESRMERWAMQGGAL